MSFTHLLMKTGANGCLRSTPASALLLNNSSRQGHVMRGKPPGVARSLEQRLQDENIVDEEVNARVNIGFPQTKPSRSEQLKVRLAHLKSQRASKQMEQLAHSNKLLIDLEQVRCEYAKTAGPFDLRVLADHYGIFEHLFGSAYFIPRVPLQISYEQNSDVSNPVFNGNVIKPVAAAQAPAVSFDGHIDPITGQPSKGDSYWTLLATNPDAPFAENAECLHWFVANIPNGKLSEGEVLVDYLQPFPAKGLGYQRFVFVLYKQEGKLDLSALKLETADNYKLERRIFSTLEFYRQNQEQLTPAGLAFYQTDWDQSLTKFYHDVLQIKEPVYEYDFPKHYLGDQKWYPLKQAFNLYMDRHRDVKQVNKEYLQRKLAKTHPFDGPEQPLRYPNAHPLRDIPSWLKTEVRKERLGTGRGQDY